MLTELSNNYLLSLPPLCLLIAVAAPASKQSAISQIQLSLPSIKNEELYLHFRIVEPLANQSLLVSSALPFFRLQLHQLIPFFQARPDRSVQSGPREKAGTCPGFLPFATALLSNLPCA